MSDKTVADIQAAIQAHVDSFSGPTEQVVEFVAMYASLDHAAGWRYAYTTGNMTNPHGCLGVVQIVGTMLAEDLTPTGGPE